MGSWIKSDGIPAAPNFNLFSLNCKSNLDDLLLNSARELVYSLNSSHAGLSCKLDALAAPYENAMPAQLKLGSFRV